MTTTEWTPGDRLLEHPGGHTRPIFQLVPDNAQMCYCQDDFEVICGADAAVWKANGDGDLGYVHDSNDYGYEPNSHVTPEDIADYEERMRELRAEWAVSEAENA